MTEQTHTTGADEMSIGDVLGKIRNLFVYFLGYWKILIPIGLLGGAYGYYRATREIPTYSAVCTFTVEDAGASKGGMSAYAGIASQFGVDIGGGSAGGLYQGETLNEFLKSRLMIQKALMTAYLPDSSKSLADVSFEDLGMRKAWDQDPRLANTRFPVGTTEFTPKQDSAMGIIWKKLTNPELLRIESVRKTSIVRLSFISSNPYFAYSFVNRLVEEATTFYTQTKTKRMRIQVNSLQDKADSLLGLLRRKYYSVAQNQEVIVNLNPAKRSAGVGVELGVFDKSLIQNMYAEVYKNLEMAKSALAQEMPNIQIIDRCRLPLTIERSSRMRATLAWGIGFGLLGMMLLGIRKLLLKKK